MKFINAAFRMNLNKRVRIALLVLITVSTFSSSRLLSQTLETHDLVGVWNLDKYSLSAESTKKTKWSTRFYRVWKSLDSVNKLIRSGVLVIRVELRKDSLYTYKQTSNQRVEYFEHGTWLFRDSSITAHNITANDRSTLDGGRIVYVNRRELVVEYHVLGSDPGAIERISYRRRR